MLFLTGYVLEKALSIDNLFVFLMIFSFFKLPSPVQHRVLRYGIWGAIIFRGIMIFGGAALVHRFSWVLLIFGAFLLFTALKMVFSKEDPHAFENSRALAFLQKRLRVTPFLLALLMIEFSDLVFALDSIPAIFAITQDAFIIFSSNIFAILGLRALYFVLADFLERLHTLRYGLALILAFVGAKLLLDPHLHISAGASLIVIATILVVTLLVGLIFPRKKS